MEPTYEIWFDLEDFSTHQVSSHGRIKNKKTGLILKAFLDRYGYLRVSIGNVDNVYVHILVCKTFIGPAPEPGMEVNHIDTNRQNNHVLNLEWVTRSDNAKWAIYKGHSRPEIALQKAIEMNHKPVRIIELDRVFPSVRDCAEFLGVLPNSVSRCLRGVRKGQRLHGYHLEYA